ncbi:MAG: HNH endonuclease [Planctomycetes bacterium]|nr:HNH endonuclease [Planctomycetota bacterium]
MGEPTKRYRSIKELVLSHVHQAKGCVNYKQLTAAVKSQFPESRWHETHWAYYRHQITKGRFCNEFSEEEKANLALAKHVPIRPRSPACAASPVPVAFATSRRGPRARDDAVKEVGDAILGHVRFVIGLAAGTDEVLRFKINRWVFARLLQDEIRVKRPTKKRLWQSGMRSCQACGRHFSSIKGVEIHRKEADKGYSADNCVLVCRQCHQSNPPAA